MIDVSDAEKKNDNSAKKNSKIKVRGEKNIDFIFFNLFAGVYKYLAPYLLAGR
jgi:hypothetical protein